MIDNQAYLKWKKHRRRVRAWIALLCSVALVGTGIGIGYVIWYNQKEQIVPSIDFEFKKGYPQQLKKGEDNSTIIILRLNGQVSNDLKLEKDPDIERNPLTHSMIDINQLSDVGEWQVGFNVAPTPSDIDLNFTIALRIITIDNKYYQSASIDSFKQDIDTSMYVPSEYLLFESKSSIKLQNEPIISLIGINVNLIIESGVDPKWTTWLIPDTCDFATSFTGWDTELVDLTNITILSFTKSNTNASFSFARNSFNSCNLLTSLDCENRNINIDAWAFYSCSNLVNVKLANNFDDLYIGVSAFSRCRNLLNIELLNFTDSNSIFIDNFSFNECFAFEGFQSNSDYVISAIGDASFISCSSLKMIDFMTTATIGKNAFFGCVNLDYIKVASWESALASIGEDAFKLCGENASHRKVTGSAANAFLEYVKTTDAELPDYWTVGS